MNLPSKIDPDFLEDLLEKSEKTYQRLGDKGTLVLVTLPNGYSLAGTSFTVSKENFDLEIGKKMALEDVKHQLWPLLGFMLMDRRSEGKSLAGDMVRWEESGVETKPPTPRFKTREAGRIYLALVKSLVSMPRELRSGKRRGGVAASESAAAAWPEYRRKLMPVYEEVERLLGIPVPILAAISSRESHHGALLDARGLGDHGHGFGVMQVDRRYHDVDLAATPGSPRHVAQAAGIFLNFWEGVKKKHPTWQPYEVLKGAFVAYNSGLKNVQTVEKMDLGTTGDDYGADVAARAWYYLKGGLES